MGVAAALSGWELIGEPRYVQGYIHGFAHPATVVEIRMGAALSPAVADAIDQQLSACIPHFAGARAGAEPPEAQGPRYGALRFLGWMQALRQLAYVPMDVPGQIFALGPDAAGVLIPCEISAKELQKSLIKAVIALIDAAIGGRALAPHLPQVATIHERLTEVAFRADAGPRFWRAAAALGIPVRELPGGTLQFGIGSASRRMMGAFSDATSVLATQLARDKRLTAQLLGQAGVPTAPQRMAETADQAISIAGALGYPVVVKPADLDGGSGVAARLESAPEVIAAFERCRALSANIIVEKFVEGRDYRVVVLNGKAFFAQERLPGGVTGNGVDSVAALIETYNAHPHRSHSPRPPLGKLLIDDELLLLLSKRGVDLQSVLPAGEFLRLRIAANIDRGGTPVPAFKDAHPDNLQLAVRAAQALRLDLAGIDLILPDITRSWRETGGVVCEVNASPGMGQTITQHLYPELMAAMVPGSGRVPVVLIVGAADPSALAQAVSAALAARGLTVGCHTPQGIRIGEEMVAQGQFVSAAAGNLLALDSKTDAMVLCINDMSPAATGLPVDRYDMLLLAGAHVSGAGGLDALLGAILPACIGAVIPLGEGSDVPARPLPGGARWTEPVLPGALAGALYAALAL